MLHPEVAFRSCEHCLKYIYSEDTGELQTFRGEPVERVLPAPCHNPKHPKGCPKGTPENPKTLSLKNQKAYQHWRECKATGNFPDDDIVRHNAAILQDMADSAAEQKQFQLFSMMMTGKGM
ncbi:hypothetical protein [Gimesia algae]|uniref:Uncharacterized protein n=1 Tax=Gimesia algae TaxID=2527971 RepID=A0A517VMV6_9PLAN|nr:hypothetical protein [Gimesia algae]QDT94359.1 hypothetical protein Pan161_60550 [Gimesia algae]